MPHSDFRVPVTHVPYYARDTDPCGESFLRDIRTPPWSACAHLLAQPDQMAVRTLGDPTEVNCWTCTLLDLRFLGTCEFCDNALGDNNSGEMLVFGRDRNFAAVGTLCRSCRETLPEDKRGGLGLITQPGAPP